MELGEDREDYNENKVASAMFVRFVVFIVLFAFLVLAAVV